MKKMFSFIKEVIVRLIDNDLYTQANAMTFRLILAIFPLVIVMIASLSFFNIDISYYIISFSTTLPYEIRQIFNNVLVDVFETRHVSILSISAFIALYSASTGFISIIRGMNKAFNQDIKVGPIAVRFLCIGLVIAFILLIVLSLGLLIFGDVIANILRSFNLGKYVPHAVYSVSLLAVGIFIGVVFLIILHKLTVDKNIPVKFILPGAFFTVTAWLIASKIFNFYVNNFYRYSILYGSIGTIFVLGLWINILCYVILIGSQINAVLCDEKFMSKI